MTGGWLLPVTAIMLALSARSGALAARIGPRLQMSLGPVVIGAGLALAARIGPASSERPCFNCAVDASALVSSTEGR